MIWVSLDGTEQMPMWCPPTPPQDEGDVYIDFALGYLYEHNIMPESELPPVYYKKDRKRPRSEIIDGRPSKMRLHYRDEASLANLMNAPRSLFDRPSPTLMKIRHELRLHKYRGGARPSIPSLKPPMLLTKNTPEPDVPEWLVHEDWTILQAIQQIQELPLSLAIISPGHIPNWDLVADIVNSSSRTYRSPKQCRIRYESVIVPREEGKILLEQNSKKQKKTKGVYKITQNKCNRVLRTSHLFSQDNNLSYTRTMNSRYDVIRAVAGRRRSVVKAVQVNPDMKNPKHAAVLVNCSIDYDNPLSPVEVATRRAERIAKQKEAAALQAAATEQQQQQQNQQQSPQQPTPQQQLAVSRLQQISAQGTVKPVVGIAGTSAGGSSTIPVSVATTISPAASTSPSNPRPSRPVKTLTVQDIVARATVSSPAPSPTSPAHRMPTTNLVTVSQASPTLTTKGKALTPAQLQVYQQQLRQQQQLRLHQARATASGSNAAVAQQKVPTVAVTSTAATSSRVQQVKQQAGVTRTMTESEMAALLKRQQQVVSTKTAAAAGVVVSGAVAGPSGVTTAAVAKTVGANLTPAQILAQAGLQAQQPGQVTALVKTATPTHMPVAGLTLPQVKVGTAGMKAGPTQQIRQLTLHQQLLASQRKMPSQKVTQLGQVMVTGKTGVPAQLIVQSQKPMPATMTMQQIQQVIKHVQPQHITHVSAAGVSSSSGVTQTVQGQPQVISHAVLTKAGQGTVTTLGSTRVIPVSTTQQSLKQIQVVTGSQGAGVRTSVSNVSLDSSGRPNVSVATGGLSGTIKVGSTVSQQALLSQVSAALQQGQGLTVRQSPVRLTTAGGGTPLVAVAVSQAPTMLTLPSHQATAEGVSKVLPQLLSRNNTNQE